MYKTDFRSCASAPSSAHRHNEQTRSTADRMVRDSRFVSFMRLLEMYRQNLITTQRVFWGKNAAVVRKSGSFPGRLEG